MRPRSGSSQSRPLGPVVRWPQLVLLSLALAAPAAALDQVWDTVRVAGRNYRVHVVSTGPLSGSFPDRPLAFGSDAGLVTDLYVVDTATGQAVEVPFAANLIALLQTSLKTPVTRR